MGLKQLIRQKKILASGAVDAELVLPGEPMIYSIKYSIGSRTRSVQYFRNEKWKSLLKCFFRSYYSTSTPVVIVAQFFVSPPSHVKVKDSVLKKENVPAVFSFELCDYLLSFIEMLHHVLINSYRQIVKFDVEKFYSKEPRTVFKFMRWEHYVQLQNNNSIHSETQSIDPQWEEPILQSKCARNVEDQGICEDTARKTLPLPDCPNGSSPCDRPFPTTGSSKPPHTKTPTAAYAPSRKKAGRRQS